MSVVEAVRRDLGELAVRDVSLADSALAATALALAADLDAVGTSATARAACARSLSDVLARLFELAPPAAARDGVDEIASRRSERRASG